MKKNRCSPPSGCFQHTGSFSFMRAEFFRPQMQAFAKHGPKPTFAGMKKAIFICLLAVLQLCTFEQAQGKKSRTQPRLMIGIVVDQMRYDYLERFSAHFTDNGFRRLMQKGYSFDNCHYNYIPTYTAPGHASIFTGTTPAVHGMVSNVWWNSETRRMQYCTSDERYSGVGSNGDEGKMSPASLKSSTIGDMLRLSNNRRSRVFGISLKDRSAILPAGHAANAAYWFDGKGGAFISSNYYMKELPAWVNKFNALRYPEMYLNQPWNLLLAPEKYRECLPDSNGFEKSFTSKPAVFPHDLKSAFGEKKNFDLLRETPYGNSFLKDFAIELFRNEKPGMGEVYDFVSISFSSTDYVGHRFGVSSMETEDTYLRLDRDLSELFSFLDSTYGKQGYTLFLTADHGACEVPAYLNTMGIPGGYFPTRACLDSLHRFSVRTFGADLVDTMDNNMVYLQSSKPYPAGWSREAVSARLADYLMMWKGISAALTSGELRSAQFSDIPRSLMQQGFYKKRGGDVLFCLEPGWMDYPKKGSTHGSSFSYDTRVPLLFYGKGIPSGRTSQHVCITDIAPTVCRFLQVAFPDGCTGNPLNDTFVIPH